MCPNCGGNNPPSNVINSIANYVQSNNVQFGQFWHVLFYLQWIATKKYMA